MKNSFVMIVLEREEFDELRQRVAKARSGYIGNIDFERILILERFSEIFAEAVLEEINGGEEDYETE